MIQVKAMMNSGFHGITKGKKYSVIEENGAFYSTCRLGNGHNAFFYKIKNDAGKIVAVSAAVKLIQPR